MSLQRLLRKIGQALVLVVGTLALGIGGAANWPKP
jgi:hypothetical protein